jgi:hypothetical protein
MIAATIGRYAIPERTGEYPQTCCTKSIMKKNRPKTAVTTHRLIRYAPVRSRDASTL